MGEEIFPATVIKVIDNYKLVINKGSLDGIKIGQRFVVYEETDELLQDPETLEALGYLEIPKGTGKISYVKEKWATIISDKTKASRQRITKRTKTIPSYATITGVLNPSTEVEEVVETPEELMPFSNPANGDKVKPI